MTTRTKERVGDRPRQGTRKPTAGGGVNDGRLPRIVRIVITVLAIAGGVIVVGSVLFRAATYVLKVQALEDTVEEIEAELKGLRRQLGNVEKDMGLLLSDRTLLQKKLYDLMLPRVMEGRIPSDQVMSPFPLETAADRDLVIGLPKHGAEIVREFYVEGLVRDLVADVWVIVRPAEGNAYIVQAEVKPWADGRWRVKLSADEIQGLVSGERCEIRAVANPTEELHEGDVLSGWPEAEYMSEIVEVRRR